MPEGKFVHPLFGLVRFRTAHAAKWVRGDAITFLSGFNTDDIKPVVIPQLAHIPGADNGTLRFHVRAHEQIKMAFADIERLGLMHHIRTCQGALNYRLKKPTNGGLSKLPSNHAFGIAIDLNADDGSLGQSVAPVAPVFEAFKFKWGKSFNDPMHFEVRSFIDHPRSIIQDVTVILNDKTIDLGAANLMGNLVCRTSKIGALPDVSATMTKGSKTVFKGPAGTRHLPIQLFDKDMAFVSLPQLCAVAGLAFDYDNESKVVKLRKTT
jgi:hypothetical protein